MLLWLHSRARSPFADSGQMVALGPGSQANGDTVLPAASINNSNAQNEPDPRKLLQGVARARQRITSGEIELQAARYEFDRPNEAPRTCLTLAASASTFQRLSRTPSRPVCGAEPKPSSWSATNPSREFPPGMCASCSI